jgi:hypothetical protein
MAELDAPRRWRVGWWAGAEAGDPLAALTGWLLRQEILARFPGALPVLVGPEPASWCDPGFTGELALARRDWPAQAGAPFEVFVASGAPGLGGAELADALRQAGAPCVAVAPDRSWGFDEALSLGAPFGVPEPALLAARHLPKRLLNARQAYLRVVEGLPRRYVLVGADLLDGHEPSADLALALSHLARRAGEDGRPARVVRLAPGPLLPEDPEVEESLRRRRAEGEEARTQPEDWPGYLSGEVFPLRVTSPVDLAAAVAGAGAVLAGTAALMALAWALGAPHVAIGPQGGPASDFAAWTGDSSALASEPAEVVATIDNVFARRGAPPGLPRLEATLDRVLDVAATDLEKGLAEAAGHGPPVDQRARAGQLVHELETVNCALRARMAAERLRFGERAALLEKTAETTLESAIKAVHGQDVMVRRRLEEVEREMHRLQEETAAQQAELRAIHESIAWRALAPLRQWLDKRGTGGT